jgi:hypothetical protein
MAVTSVRAWITASRLGYGPLLVMMALVFGLGCCVFDGHADDEAGLDLCFGMLGVAIVAASLCRLLQSGMIAAFAPALLTGTAPHILDPPPRLLA